VVKATVYSRDPDRDALEAGGTCCGRTQRQGVVPARPWEREIGDGVDGEGRDGDEVSVAPSVVVQIEIRRGTRVKGTGGCTKKRIYL
jgi:hypothetical protein